MIWLLVIAAVGVAISLHPAWNLPKKPKPTTVAEIWLQMKADFTAFEEAMARVQQVLGETSLRIMEQREAALRRGLASFAPDAHRPMREQSVCDECQERLSSGIAPERLHHTACWEAAILEEA